MQRDIVCVCEREREIANTRDKDRKKYCKRSGQSHFQREKKK